MWQACSAGLTLAVLIIVLKLFLPEVANDLIVLIIKILRILIQSIDQASANLPQ